MKLKAISSLKEAKRDKNVIKNVHVLGFESKNGYVYNKEAVKKAVEKYEGKPVYLNHKHVRSVEDKIGLIAGVSFNEESGIWAKSLILNEAHPAYKQLIWWAENHPNQIGLSHSIEGEMNEDRNEVTNILDVESADIVASPATTGGLHEAIKAENNRLDRVLEAFYTDAIDLLMSGSTDKLLDHIQTLQNAIKESDMDLTKLTLEELAKLRPDLAEQLKAQGAALEKKVQEALAKVPENARTDVFAEQVRAVIADDKKLEAIIKDRIEVSKVQTATSTAPGSKKQEEEHKETEEEAIKRVQEETRKQLNLKD